MRRAPGGECGCGCAAAPYVWSFRAPITIHRITVLAGTRVWGRLLVRTMSLVDALLAAEERKPPFSL